MLSQVLNPSNSIKYFFRKMSDYSFHSKDCLSKTVKDTLERESARNNLLYKLHENTVNDANLDNLEADYQNIELFLDFIDSLAKLSVNFDSIVKELDVKNDELCLKNSFPPSHDIIRQQKDLKNLILDFGDKVQNDFAKGYSELAAHDMKLSTFTLLAQKASA